MSELPSSPATTTPNEDVDKWVVARVGASGFRTEISSRSHTFVADEPHSLGGTDEGPTPYEYLLGALSGCMAMTLRMYANRKRWPLESVEISLRSARSHGSDCQDCETEDVGINRIERRIVLAGPLADDQKKRLLEIADRCPVKQTLERTMKIVSVA